MDDQALDAGRLEHTLGVAFSRLGHLETAERHFSQAALLRSRTRGPDHPETVDSMAHLAWARYVNGGDGGSSGLEGKEE